MELSDLEWYEANPDNYFGEDKDGNVYNMYLKPMPGMSLNNPYWGGATVEMVQEAIERDKKAGFFG